MTATETDYDAAMQKRECHAHRIIIQDILEADPWRLVSCLRFAALRYKLGSDIPQYAYGGRERQMEVGNV